MSGTVESHSAHQGREGYDDHRGRRQRDEERDDAGAGQVDPREKLAFAGPPAQDAGRVRAQDVRQPDDRQGPRPELGGSRGVRPVRV